MRGGLGSLINPTDCHRICNLLILFITALDGEEGERQKYTLEQLQCFRDFVKRNHARLFGQPQTACERGRLAVLDSVATIVSTSPNHCLREHSQCAQCLMYAEFFLRDNLLHPRCSALLQIVARTILSYHIVVFEELLLVEDRKVYIEKMLKLTMEYIFQCKGIAMAKLTHIFSRISRYLY